MVAADNTKDDYLCTYFIDELKDLFKKEGMNDNK